MRKYTIYCERKILEGLPLRKLQMLSGKRVYYLKQNNKLHESEAFRVFNQTVKHHRTREDYITFLSNPTSLP